MSGISAEKMARYRAAARQREETRQRQVQVRFDRAWQTARLGAKLLREKYAIPQVWVFGSLLRPERFYERSDIDLAVWELEDQNWLQAIGDLFEIDADFSIDLVELKFTTESLRQRVLEEGQIL